MSAGDFAWIPLGKCCVRLHFLFVWPWAGPALCPATAFHPTIGYATEKLFATRGQESSGRCRVLDGEPGNRRNNRHRPIETATCSRCVFSPLFAQRFFSIRHDSGPPTTPFIHDMPRRSRRTSRPYLQDRGYMPYNLRSPCHTKKYS